MRKPTPFLSTARVLLAAACGLSSLSAAAVTVAPHATIVVISRDPAGFGFNDPTPVLPVGGNPGTTLGEQRFNVYRYVADIWEQNLQSDVTIKVNAGWEALTCNATSAVLGSAGASSSWRNFPNGKPNTWYPSALASKLSGTSLRAETAFDITTQFNINLGAANCLAGSTFYLGFDGKAGSNVNFVETLLHEIGHGLGFALGTTNASTGARSSNSPSIWEGFMYDNTARKFWIDMNNAERAASAINPLKLAWSGPNVAAGQGLLSATPVIGITAPVLGISGQYDYMASAFGPAIATPSALGKLATVVDQSTTGVPNGQGCDTFNAANTASVKGKVAIMTRGVCGFAVKVKNAQNAGAIGALLVNNVAGLITPGGADATVTIPSGMISQADGAVLAAAVPASVPYGSRSTPGSVTASWVGDPTRIAGADSSGRPLLYTPNPFVSGSSVSHWDVSATPNLLMEPNINADLGTIMVAPKDLTVPLLKDIGW